MDKKRDKMKIRPAKKSDINAFVKTQAEAFPHLNSQKQKRYFLLKLKNKEIIVIEDKGNYVGHLCYKINTLEPPFQNSLFLEELAVKKDLRSKGYGTKLMKYIVDFAKKKKIKIIYLGTGDYKKNKAIKYYERQGFKKVGYLDEIDRTSEYDYGDLFMAVLVNKWKSGR